MFEVDDPAPDRVVPGSPAEFAALIAACRALHAAWDAFDHAAAMGLGLARNDLRCLNALEHGPLTAGQVGARLDLTSGSVTALLDRLERRGFVARQPDPGDRRGVRVTVTPLAFEQLGDLYRRQAEEIIRAAATYAPEERAAAVRHVEDLARACRMAMVGATGRD